MWRANACPSWLFAPLAGRLAWNGMGQALAFLVSRYLVLGTFELSVPGCLPQMPQEQAGF